MNTGNLQKGWVLYDVCADFAAGGFFLENNNLIKTGTIFAALQINGYGKK